MESGLQFDFSYAAGTTFEQMVAFETAGMMWSDYISDDMTVNIHVEMTNTLPDNVIGGALPGMVADVNYTDFRNAYHNDITSGRDRLNFDSLSLLREGTGGKGPGGTWEKFEARIDFGGDHFVEDSGELNMTRANAKALGLIAGNDATLDGYIMMNDLSDSSLNWDYSKDWTPGNSLDFLSTAVHEVGHVLGFVSGVDKYEGMKFDDYDSFWNHFGTYDAFKTHVNNIVDYANPLDLFRYSQESLAVNNGRNTIEMSVGTQAYFGPAKLWHPYATGKETSIDGDGFQASHWKQRNDDEWTLGIMDPLMKPGIIRRISDRDVQSMDAIGYDVNHRADHLFSRTVAETGWRPVTGGGTDLGTLQWQAKDHLAKSLYSNGQASWFQHWEQHQPWKANEMTSNKSWEVDSMVEQSEVYEGRSSRGRSSRRSYSQEIFWQEAYFSSISSEYSNAPSSASLDSAFAMTSIVQIEQNTFETNVINKAKDTATLEDEDSAVMEITSVSVNLLSLEAGLELVNTVSTKIETELTFQSDLYGKQLEEADLHLFSV